MTDSDRATDSEIDSEAGPSANRRTSPKKPVDSLTIFPIYCFEILRPFRTKIEANRKSKKKIAKEGRSRNRLLSCRAGPARLGRIEPERKERERGKREKERERGKRERERERGGGGESETTRRGGGGDKARVTERENRKERAREQREGERKKG